MRSWLVLGGWRGRRLGHSCSVPSPRRRGRHGCSPGPPQPLPSNTAPTCCRRFPEVERRRDGVARCSESLDDRLGYSDDAAEPAVLEPVPASRLSPAPDQLIGVAAADPQYRSYFLDGEEVWALVQARRAARGHGPQFPGITPATAPAIAPGITPATGFLPGVIPDHSRIAPGITPVCVGARCPGPFAVRIGRHRPESEEPAYRAAYRAAYLPPTARRFFSSRSSAPVLPKWECLPRGPLAAYRAPPSVGPRLPRGLPRATHREFVGGHQARVPQHRSRSAGTPEKPITAATRSSAPPAM